MVLIELVSSNFVKILTVLIILINLVFILFLIKKQIDKRYYLLMIAFTLIVISNIILTYEIFIVAEYIIRTVAQIIFFVSGILFIYFLLISLKNSGRRRK